MADDVGDAFDVHVDDGGKITGRHLTERGIAVDDGGVIEQQVGRAGQAQAMLGPIAHGFIAGDVHDLEAVVRAMQGVEFFNRIR